MGRSMVGLSASVALVAPLLPVNHDMIARGKTAAIVKLGKTPFPPLPDFQRACADLIWRTFPAASQRAVCDRAERETGLASSDTFDRLLSGRTGKPDAYLMHCVMGLAAARGVAIPPELAVRT